jgi:hypothetical protein
MMRRFTVIMLCLIAIIWLVKLLLPEPTPPMKAAMEPRTAPVAPSVPAATTPTVYAPPVNVVSKAKAQKTEPCQDPDDRAADGSRCGNRAASVRPSGK